MKDKKEYIRLPRSRAFIVKRRTSLYAGEDHLLCISNSGYTEDYKRFYYKDICAIVASKTAIGRNWSVAFCVFALLLAFLPFTSESLWTTDFLKLSGLFSVFFLINYLRGPTCKAYLRTAVSEEELPSLNRMKQAVKAMDILRPIIEESQGRLTPEEMETASAEMAEKVPPSLGRVVIDSQPGQYARSYGGKTHEMLFYLLLAGGALTFSEFFFNNPALTLLEMLTGAAIVVFGIMSVIKQHEGNMKGELLGITWAALGYVIFSFIVNYFIYMFIAIKNPEAIDNQLELLRLYSAVSPSDNPFLEWFYIITIVFSFAIGIRGLVLLRKYRSAAV